jgi:hypothetical protein
MTETVTWHSGTDDFMKHTLEINRDTKKHNFTTELREDVPIRENMTMEQLYIETFNKKQTKFVQIMFSGGLDSEYALHVCLSNKIPVEAITMRLRVKGVVVNTQDMYYSTNFCRTNNVTQVIIDLDVDKFMERGDHFRYLDPYLITQHHVATHFWLSEQCTGFPIIGGYYSWPWTSVHNPRFFSPIRSHYGQYHRFMQDKGIHGIGNMMMDSLDTNMLYVKTHISIMENDTDEKYGGDYYRMVAFKQALFTELGYKNPEPRFGSFGWESVNRELFNVEKVQLELEDRYGTTTSKIVWGKKMAALNKSSPGSNTRFK